MTTNTSESSVSDDLGPTLLTVTDRRPELLAVALMLHQEAGLPPPSDVKILTTRSGRSRLLDFATPLRNDMSRYTARQRPVTSDDIELFTDEAGEPVHDLESEAALSNAGDSFLTTVRDLTQDDARALHIIIPANSPLASFATLAMTYFARPQDRFSLLITPAEFWIDDCFFDLAACQPLAKKCSLLEIHTALLRSQYMAFCEELKNVPRVRAWQLAQGGQPALAFNFLDCEVIIHSRYRVSLEPSQLSFYYWLASRASQLKPGIHPTDENAALEFLWVRQYVLNYAVKNPVKNSRRDKSAQTLLTTKEAFHKFFDEKKSAVNRRLKEVLPVALYKRYQIVGTGTRPKKYTVPLKGERIGIIDA